MEINVEKHLEKLYYGQTLEKAKEEFKRLLEDVQIDVDIQKPNEKTSYLITYGDSFFSANKNPLQTLKEVVEEKLPNITDVHILPMFPYTSDDGFSVVDYLTINPDLGEWEDIEDLSQVKKLMFDFVCNHMSKSSEWFKLFLEDDPKFEKAFIEFDGDFDSSKTTRPRVSPLFHHYQTKRSEKIVWTTFSEDQVDTNVGDPIMLARLTSVLLEYIKKGASSIRLDAIGFMWKESGTTSMHLEQTHEIIKMWRTIIDKLAPNMQIITETNVPHKENISYFGNGLDEANMVYQFPLPPLTLHTLISGDASKLSQWAKSIEHVSDNATYFNFLASHDGIGLRPTEGILDDTERQVIIDTVLEAGGRASYKKNIDGTESVYELNVNYASALGSVEKMLAAHAILLSFIGVPAIYYHSIFGSKNDEKGLKESGINRRINREKLNKDILYRELEEDCFRKNIYTGISKLLKVRKSQLAFNPYGSQEVIDFGKSIFALKRTYKNKSILALVNISDKKIVCEQRGLDIITNKEFSGILSPYEYVWLEL